MRSYKICFSACGSNGNGRTVGLDDLVGLFQPCDSMILWLNSVKSINAVPSCVQIQFLILRTPQAFISANEALEALNHIPDLECDPL